uniref:Uncharacterized protein n=1 Tax=Leersia perrieri TaxID=77586 RepID=A0A0D9VIE8_9ORYZ
MEGRNPTRRHPPRHRSGRIPPPGPPHLRLRPTPPPSTTLWVPKNPSRHSAAAYADDDEDMDDDAITALMDIDDSPRSSGAGAVFLDEDEDAEVFTGNRAPRGINEARGPLPFSGFFNSFDGADFDDTDLA